MSGKVQRVIGFLYGLLFLATPLLMFHKTSEIFEFNKMLFIYLMTIGIGACWIGKMVIEQKIVIRKTPLDIPLFLFLASQVISTLVSIDRHTSLFGYYGRFNGGLISIICYIILYYALVSNEINVLNLVRVSLFSSLFVIVWGLPSRLGFDFSCWIFTGSPTNACWTSQFNPAVRMFSTIGQPNWLGAYLAVNFFLGLYFFCREKKVNRATFLISGYLLLNFITLLFTRSKSALGAITVGLSIYFIYAMMVNWKESVNNVRRYLIIFAIIFIPIVIFKTGIEKVDRYLRPNFSLSHSTTRETTVDQPLPSGVTDSLDIRKIVWRGGLDVARLYPFFGSGVETFAYSYYFVRPKEHNLTSEWDFVYNKAHNEYINYFATAGFFGLASYLLLIASVFWIVGKKIGHTKNGEKGLLALSLIVAYITILITNFVGFSTTTIQLFFYLIPAFLVADLLRTAPDKSSITDTTPLSFNKKMLLVVPVMIVVVGAGFVVRYWLADINYATAQNLQRQQEYEQAGAYLQKALSLKYEHVYEDKIGQNYANLAFLVSYDTASTSATVVNSLIDTSDQHSRRALLASPKNALYWRNRAKNYFIFYQITKDSHHFNQAISTIRSAEKLAPTDPKNYYTEALFYSFKLDTKGITDSKKRFAFETALIDIDMAIILKADYREAYVLKGQMYKKMGYKDQAKKIFEFIITAIDKNDQQAQQELKDL